MVCGLGDFLASIALLFDPGTCFFCQSRIAAGHQWCRQCDGDIKRLGTPYCSRCGLPLPGRRENHLCQECLLDKPRFNRSRSLLVYEEKSRDLVQAVKYQKRIYLLRQLMDSYRFNGINELDDSDLIIPVPLHDSRLKARGYNQSLLISRIVFRAEKKRIDPFTLVRTRKTRSQTGMNGSERRRNLKGAFAVKNRERIKGKKILLVDDVFTTGTTVNECARTLYKSGAARVDVFTLARVPRSPYR